MPLSAPTLEQQIKAAFRAAGNANGEEAEDIQFNRKYQTWFWETNKLQHTYELWRTNKEKWEKELKFR